MACGGPRSEDDIAQICPSGLQSGTDTGWPSVAVDAGQPLELEALFGGGCHMADMAVTCDVTPQGDRLVVHTESTWVRTEPLAWTCESIYYKVTGTCTTPPLDAGTWTLAYAGQELVFDVPGAVTGCIDP